MLFCIVPWNSIRKIIHICLFFLNHLRHQRCHGFNPCHEQIFHSVHHPSVNIGKSRRPSTTTNTYRTPISILSWVTHIPADASNDQNNFLILLIRSVRYYFIRFISFIIFAVHFEIVAVYKATSPRITVWFVRPFSV